MRFKSLPLILLACAGASLATAAQSEESTPQPAHMARNPIIWADVPDVAVIRVGDAYYMSSTTMHMSPGVPIMKSTDLVNWDIVSYAYDTLADNDALNLANGQDAYGAGSWASSLRHHDGTYYVSTFSSTSGKTHIYTTQDIENGPWRAQSFEPSLHDHSLFFDDDGRVYMIYGGGTLHIQELEKDLSGLKEGGVSQVLIENASAPAGDDIGLPAEGSQLLKVGDYYYLLNITWPRGGMRTVVVHRAKSITGPYEGRVALQDKGVAQGCLIDTPDGEWWGFLFQDQGAVGRTPYIVPVHWEDNWPVFGIDGKAPEYVDLPPNESLKGRIVASDEFNRAEGDNSLPLVWQWNHNPVAEHWSLTEREGFLRLTNGRVVENLEQARNTLTQRTFGPTSSARTRIDVSHMKAGDVAGLVAFQQKYGYVGIRDDGGERSIVMVRVQDGQPVTEATAPLSGSTVHLRVDCDFRDHRDTAWFYYSADGENWTRIGEELKMEYTLPKHFMGYRFGLFNMATETPGGSVDFDFYHVEEGIAEEAGVH